MKLSVKNTIILSVLVSISLITLSTISYIKSKKIIEDNFNTLATTQLHSIQNEIEQWIEGKQLIQETIAETTTVKKGDMKEIFAFDKRLKERLPNIENAVVYGDLKGTVYLPGGETVNAAGYPHYLATMKGKEFTMDPIPSDSTGKPTILSSAPVYNDKKEIIAWLTGGHYMEDLVKTISKISLGEKGYATVFTKDGTIIGHRNADYILKKNISDFNNKDLNKLVENAIKGKKGYIKTTFNGEKVIVYYSKTANDWGIMVQIPESEAYAQVNELLHTVIAITIITILITAVINFFVIRNSLKQLYVISNQTKDLASSNGDLTKRLVVKNNDEIGELSTNFNSMLGNIQNLITKIISKGKNVADNTNHLSSNIEQVSELSKSITGNMQELSESSNEQLSSNTKNLHSIEDISNNISEIKNSTSLLSNESQSIFKQAQDGDKKVNDLEHQMGIIQNTVEKSSKIVDQLGSRSIEIGEIVHIISNISEKTNLLALNASIESARAGEHGKGFSVVAEEVKKLAVQSNESSKQIYDIIEKIQTETNEAKKRMEVGTNEVNLGVTKVKEIGILLNNIVTSTNNSVTQIQNMVQETEDLLNIIKVVESNVKRSNSTVESSASYLEDVASSSEEQLSSITEIKKSIGKTSDEIQELLHMLNQFKI